MPIFDRRSNGTVCENIAIAIVNIDALVVLQIYLLSVLWGEREVDHNSKGARDTPSSVNLGCCSPNASFSGWRTFLCYIVRRTSQLTSEFHRSCANQAIVNNKITEPKFKMQNLFKLSEQNKRQGDVAAAGGLQIAALESTKRDLETKKTKCVVLGVRASGSRGAFFNFSSI